jgi:hypothetical protein
MGGYSVHCYDCGWNCEMDAQQQMDVDAVLEDEGSATVKIGLAEATVINFGAFMSASCYFCISQRVESHDCYC